MGASLEDTSLLAPRLSFLIVYDKLQVAELPCSSKLAGISIRRALFLNHSAEHSSIKLSLCRHSIYC